MGLKLFLSRLYYNKFSVEKRFEKWDYLDKTQWLSRGALLEIQENKLKAILKYSVANVPVFNELKGKVDFTDNIEVILSKFPVTDKSFYRNAGESCRSNKSEELKYFGNSTSGSTGESFYFDLDMARHGWAAAAKYRTDTFSKTSPDQSRASLWGASFDYKKKRTLKDRIRGYLTPFTFLSSYDLSEEKIKEYVVLLRKNRPQLLISYPTPLVEFSEYCLKYGIELNFIKSIICSSEQLYDFQREIIETAFKAEVYNRYGTREFGSIAQECGQGKGLHVNVERVFIEILDENDKSCKPGEKGQLVITDLDNKIMPLVRYKVGDFAAWDLSTSCRCGRGLPKLKFVEGRSFDVIKTPNGTVISGTFWTLLIRYVSKDIKEFQILQNTKSSIDINIVTLSGKMINETEAKTLELRIKEKDENLIVSINLVPEIKLTKSGKRRFVISNL